MRACRPAGRIREASPVRMIWLVLSGVALAAPACARSGPTPSVPAPRVSVNDSWTYHHKGRNRTGWHEGRFTLTVRRVEANEIVVAVTHPDSDLPPVERMLPADWSRERSVNGHQTVVNRPLAFPLSIGKAWRVEYTEDHPNRQHTSERFVQPYKVTGWEDVTVPAGTFHALKIESEGEWFAAIAPAMGAAIGTRRDAAGATTVARTVKITPHIVSGHMYKAFWYVPAVKRWVKATEEFYNGNGVRYEYYVNELESYRVAK